MKWIHSLRTKLLYIYLGISLISFIIFSTIIYKGLENSLTNQMQGELLREIQEKFIIMVLVTGSITVIFIIIISGIIMNPIKQMLKVIEKMTEGRFDQKIKVRGHDELSELSMAFNQMSAKLQKVDASRQEFVANVSHELKTPLSSMKVLIESLLFQENVPEETYKEFLA
ncbi:MAG TPA: hypothetical protein DEG71_01225, partial [Clostridiales bacterium]|nr:hypothetical protein [Clostridiales bacterium]